MRTWLPLAGGVLIGGVFGLVFSHFTDHTGRVVGGTIFIAFCAAGWIDFFLATFEVGVTRATLRSSSLRS